MSFHVHMVMYLALLCHNPDFEIHRHRIFVLTVGTYCVHAAGECLEYIFLPLCSHNGHANDCCFRYANRMSCDVIIIRDDLQVDNWMCACLLSACPRMLSRFELLIITLLL